MRYGCNSAVGVINCGLPDFSGDDGDPDSKGVDKEIHSANIGNRLFDDCRRTGSSVFSTGSQQDVFAEIPSIVAFSLAKQCSDVLAQEGKVLDEIQVACTSQGEIQAIAVRIRSPEEKQEGNQIDLGYIQVGDNSEPKPEWRQSFAKKLADCWGVEADTIEILEGKS